MPQDPQHDDLLMGKDSFHVPLVVERAKRAGLYTATRIISGVRAYELFLDN